MTRRFSLFCLLSLSACRYLGPVSPQVTRETPALLGRASDPTRQAQLPGRACIVECGPGQHCDEAAARCVPNDAGSDAGVRWLP